jgi:hypothetical protein
VIKNEGEIAALRVQQTTGDEESIDRRGTKLVRVWRIMPMLVCYDFRQVLTLLDA